MKGAFVVWLAGLLFGVGLFSAGMTNPRKVQNFLDVFGNWDPSLALVLGAAIATHAPLLALIRRRKPLFARTFHIPTKRHVDPRLLGGAALFGIGWGLIGYCPGPVLVSLPTLHAPVWVFVAAMLAGMWIAHRVGLSKSR